MMCKLFRKKKLIVAKKDNELLLELIANFGKIQNEYGKQGAIMERRDVWKRIAELFPETLKGNWRYDIPVQPDRMIEISRF